MQFSCSTDQVYVNKCVCQVVANLLHLRDTKSMKEIKEFLKQKGLKATEPRLAVLNQLYGVHDPVSADDLFLKLKKKGADKVTIYRTLESFQKIGLLREVVFKDKISRYELVHNSGHHCHHAVCDICGATEHIEDQEIEKALDVLSSKFKKMKYISEHALEFFGICKSCSVKPSLAKRSITS